MRLSRLVLLVPLALCFGCGTERAVRVRFDLARSADALCVLAGDGRDVSFVQRYDATMLPDPATLTFVAGAPSRNAAVIGALGVSGGRIVATGHLTVSLAGDGTFERSLEVSDCRLDAPGGLGLRPSGSFAALLPSSRLFAADLDGDGREELLAIAGDGSLAVLDAEDPDAGSRRATELLTSEGRITASADFDGDCRLDLLATANLGVLRIVGADGSSPAPIGPGAPRDATVVELARVSGPLIAVASSDGLSLLDPFDGTAAPISADPIAFVVAGDFDGDRAGDVLVGGDGSPTRIFLGGASTPSEQPGAGIGLLATATGPAVAGDFDGDGLTDVALLDGTSIRILSYGSGTLAEIPTSVTPADVQRLAAGDIDGDCAADLVVLDGTTVRYLRHQAGELVEGMGPGVPADDLVIADVDGDGAREVALLGSGGRVTLWVP